MTYITGDKDLLTQKITILISQHMFVRHLLKFSLN